MDRLLNDLEDINEVAEQLVEAEQDTCEQQFSQFMNSLSDFEFKQR